MPLWIACCDYYKQRKDLTVEEHRNLTTIFFPKVLNAEGTGEPLAPNAIKHLSKEEIYMHNNTALLVQTKILLEQIIVPASHARKADGTPVFDAGRKIRILKAFAEASPFCSSRLYEETYRIAMEVNLTPIEEQPAYLVHLVINEMLREFVTVTLFNDASDINLFRCLFQKELKMLLGSRFEVDLKIANLENHSPFRPLNKEFYLNIF